MKRTKTGPSAVSDSEAAGEAPKPAAGNVQPLKKPVPAKPKPDVSDKPAARLTPKMPQPKPVKRARLRKRHFGLIFSFLLLVIAPIGGAGWYLFEKASDQYASRVGFSVRKQDVDGPVNLLEGIGQLSTTSTLDTDILYEFIQSQEMVELVDAKLDLRSLYSKPDDDPIFAFDPDQPVEELLSYWQSMVAVYYDSGTGLIELRVRAFTAEDAVAIAEETLTQSSLMINKLSTIARDDTTRYASETLAESVERLKVAQQELTQFRVQQNIVDPEADVQVQMSLLSSLQQQLAETLIELDLLIENTNDTDPRVNNLRRQVDIIQRRIDEERQKFGLGGDGSQAFSTLIAEFESLSIDMEFARTSYLNALAAYDSAQRQAQQQSRYLAAYLNPTRPQSAEFPQRETLLGMFALFVFLMWSILTLIYYSVKDRS